MRLTEFDQVYLMCMFALSAAHELSSLIWRAALG